ncbi:MAG: DUF2304 domain-containing protein [Candidatus Alcyoniella australis]|nr:DUF2304 domain-containing protein [Candidatus Alcyoniella australis]
MTPYQRMMAIVVALMFFGLVLYLVRSYRLSERLALLWLAISVMIAAIAAWEPLLMFSARIVGAEVPISGLHFWGIMTLLVLTLLQSVKTHKLHKRSLRLIQEVALLKDEIRRLREGEKLAPKVDGD